MAALLILLIIGLLAVAVLLWCLAGFSRALNEKPKVIALLVRVADNDTNVTQRRNHLVIPFPEPLSLLHRTEPISLKSRKQPGWRAG
jgi:hypothetical protein